MEFRNTLNNLHEVVKQGISRGQYHTAQAMVYAYIVSGCDKEVYELFRVATAVRKIHPSLFHRFSLAVQTLIYREDLRMVVDTATGEVLAENV